MAEQNKRDADFKGLATDTEAKTDSVPGAGRVLKTVHMCLDIRGALMNYGPSDYVGMFKRDDGSLMSWREAKATLMDELAKGRKVLPFGDCEGFDYETGCPGHPAALTASTDPPSERPANPPKNRGYSRID